MLVLDFQVQSYLAWEHLGLVRESSMVKQWILSSSKLYFPWSVQFINLSITFILAWRYYFQILKDTNLLWDTLHYPSVFYSQLLTWIEVYACVGILSLPFLLSAASKIDVSEWISCWQISCIFNLLYTTLWSVKMMVKLDIISSMRVWCTLRPLCREIAHSYLKAPKDWMNSYSRFSRSWRRRSKVALLSAHSPVYSSFQVQLCVCLFVASKILGLEWKKNLLREFSYRFQNSDFLVTFKSQLLTEDSEWF